MNNKIDQYFRMLYFPDDMIKEIIQVSEEINCIYVCRKWNKIVCYNKLKLYKFNYTQLLLNEILSIIFEKAETLNSKYVCSRWNDIINLDFKINCKDCHTIRKKYTIHYCPECFLYVQARAINFLLISVGSAILRY